MPLCRFVHRTLSFRRNAVFLRDSLEHRVRRSHLQPIRGYNATLAVRQRNNHTPSDGLDPSNILADPGYLDFLLGPEVLEAPGGGPAPETLATAADPSFGRNIRAVNNESLTARNSLRCVKKPTVQDGKHRPRNPQSSRRTSPKQSSRTALKKGNIRNNLRGEDSRRIRELARYWTLRASKLLRHVDRRQGNATADELQLPPEVSTWATEALGVVHNLPQRASEEATESLHLETQRWQAVALWLLFHFPRQMIPFLQATHESCPPCYAVQMSLKYLVLHFETIEGPEKHQQMQRLITLVHLLASRKDGARLSLKGNTIRRLLLYCNEEQVHEMWTTIKTHGVTINLNTMLQFATFFAKHDDFEKALHAVLDANAAGADLTHGTFLSTCSTLLRRSIRMPGGFRLCLRLVDNLVQMGLGLNTQLCNVIMLNAVEAGDMKTALTVYHSLVEHGLEADQYTYGILLKGCKLLDDAEVLNEIIRSTIAHVHGLQAPLLATEVLHCLALHHTQRDPEGAYKTIIDAYTQLFDTEPLQRLGIPLPDPSSLNHSVEQRMQPSVQAIGIMLRAYLFHNYTNSRPTQVAYGIYRRYRTLLQTTQEPFTALAATDYIPNAFLIAFVRTKKGLLYAAEVVRDMQRPIVSDSGLQIAQCAPTVQTWSIFLHGFTRHGDLALAEQTLKYMRSKGIEPNQVTWNSLVAGYAAQQNLDGLLDALRRLEASGAVWDDFTVGGLGRFCDAESLQQRLRDENALDFTADLKERLEKRLAETDGARTA